MANPTAPKPISTHIYSTDLSSDLSTLLSLPLGTTESLSNLKPFNQSQKKAGSASASELLSNFSTSSKDLDAGVVLSGAYVKEMRSLQKQGLEGELESAGEGIEGVRVRAEGVQKALGEVKL